MDEASWRGSGARVVKQPRRRKYCDTREIEGAANHWRRVLVGLGRSASVKLMLLPLPLGWLEGETIK